LLKNSFFSNLLTKKKSTARTPGTPVRLALQSPSLGYPFETAFLAHRDHLSFFE